MPKELLIQKAIDYNYLSGWKFVEALRTRRTCTILYPADLIPIHQHWEQAHFQALWLSIIAEKCTEVHMTEGWEYSNGGSEEFTHVMQLKLGLPQHSAIAFWNTKENEESQRERMRNIRVYDHKGGRLDIGSGITAIMESLLWLNNHGFEAKTLENSLQLLHWTSDMIEGGFYQ